MIVLTTGGTIASTPSAAGVVASAGGDRLVAGGLVGVGIAPEVRSLTSVNGFAIETAQMLSIARAVRDGAKEGIGVVVTRGTDTLEGTAYLTDLLEDGDARVIFTGAQRHAAHPDSDGPATLRAAVVLAAGPRLRGSGVLVAMNGLVDAARCARKVHGRATGAFGGGEPDASPNWAPRAFDSSNCRSAVPRCRVRCDRTCRARRTGRGDNVLVPRELRLARSSRRPRAL